MREILFRGKRVDNGEWVEGFYGQFHNRPTIKEPNIHQIFVLFTEEEERENEGHFLSAVGGLWHKIKPETLGQYTGLIDKNGKKIFEGDIVKNDIGIKTSVEFFKGRYYPFIAFPEYRCWDEEECEVIGNIHDNPELLKKRG